MIEYSSIPSAAAKLGIAATATDSFFFSASLELLSGSDVLIGMGREMTGETLTLALRYGGTPGTSARGNSSLRWVLLIRAKIRRRKLREEIPKILPVWRKWVFSESTEEGEHLCTRISDNGHVFKSAVKLCHLLMEMSFVSQSQGLNSGCALLFR